MMNVESFRGELENAGFDVVAIGLKNGIFDFYIELNRQGFRRLVCVLKLDISDETIENFNSLSVDNKYGYGTKYDIRGNYDDEMRDLLYLAIDMWLIDVIRKYYR